MASLGTTFNEIKEEYDRSFVCQKCTINKAHICMGCAIRLVDKLRAERDTLRAVIKNSGILQDKQYCERCQAIVDTAMGEEEA